MERDTDRRRGEQGFMLLAMVVAIFLVLVALSVAAPRMARELRREREVEAVRRGNQYVRALQLYTKRGQGPFPGSMEQLEKMNNVRFLRRKYLDPMTGKVDWRLIHVGEAKTTVKGFFGEPLMGLATSGVGGTGAVAASPGIGGAAAGTGGIGPTSTLGSSSSAYGSSTSGGIGSASGSGGTLGAGSPTVGSSGTAGAGGVSGASGTSTTPGTPGTTGTDTSNGLGLTQSSGMPGGGAPIMGFGLPVEGDSIIVLNEQASYPKWEFIYDPRIEQLKKNASLFGGASAANSSGTGALTPSAGMSGAGSTGTGTGTSTGTGMNTPGFGSTSSGATGSNTTGSGTTGSGTAPTTTPAPTPAPQQ